MIILAVISVICCLYLLHERSLIKIGLWAVLSCGLYLALGHPDVQSAPALFENQGPRYEMRLATQRQIDLLHHIRDNPRDHMAMMELVGLQLATNQRDKARLTLDVLLKTLPKDDPDYQKLKAISEKF